MKLRLFLLACAMTPVLAAPAMAQTRSDEQRWRDAQRRFENERVIYDRERARYDEARRRYGRYNDRYNNNNNNNYNDRYATDYDAARYYRDDPRYSERVLTAEDEVYRGSDGRYYCRRSDGTTGLIIGAAGGAVLGNVLDGGGNRAAGTLIGGALGALIGREVERNQVRCR